MTRIAIAGASGFLGSHLAEKLSQNASNEIVALVRGSSRRENLAGLQTEFREVDYSMPDSVTGCLSDIDIVINCIALLGDFDHLSKSRHYAVDAGTLETLLKNVNKSRLQQFIHISTTGVYGGKSTPDPLNEDSPFGKVVSKYEWGKIEAEKVLGKIRKEQLVPATIARPGPVFGPRMVYGWPNLIKRIKNGTFRMIGTGEAQFHVTYVDDIVDGVCLLVGNDKAVGNDFNVCGDEIPTINEYFNAICSELNGPLIKHLPYLPVIALAHLLQMVPKALKPGDLSLLSPGRVRFFREHRIFDNSKLKSVTGFQTKSSLKKGIQRTLLWYSEHGYI